jgi:hypothetical protein
MFLPSFFRLMAHGRDANTKIASRRTFASKNHLKEYSRCPTLNMFWNSDEMVEAEVKIPGKKLSCRVPLQRATQPIPRPSSSTRGSVPVPRYRPLRSAVSNMAAHLVTSLDSGSPIGRRFCILSRCFCAMRKADLRRKSQRKLLKSTRNVFNKRLKTS